MFVPLASLAAAAVLHWSSEQGRECACRRSCASAALPVWGVSSARAGRHAPSSQCPSAHRRQAHDPGHLQRLVAMHATRSAGAMARWARTGCALPPGRSAVALPSTCGRPFRRVAAAASSLTYPPPIVSRPTAPHTATCILLHGLGDSGNGWAAIADEFKSDLPYVKFVFPNAPVRPITLNWGMQMPGWYDIKSLEDINQVEDSDGLFESKRYVEELVQAEAEAGVPSDRVVVAGFSQGGATALMMLRSELKLAGIVGMSSYLPLRDLEPQLSAANSSTPVLLCHGDSDMTVAYHNGRESRDKLRQLGVDVEFITYTGMAHSACSEELQDVLQFLKTHLKE